MPFEGSEPIIDGPLPGPFRHVEFDPDKHLCFDPPTSILTWEDLGYPKDHGVSPIAAVQPFRLFTDEAIQHMRDEILQEEVLKKFRVSSTIAAMQVRGYVESHAPFIYSAWKHPRTLEILSKAMGIDLAIKVDHEIGHVNFAVKPNTFDAANATASGYADTDAAAATHYSAEKEVVGWHNDSYPFSCVTMLSDATNIKEARLSSKEATPAVASSSSTSPNSDTQLFYKVVMFFIRA